MHSSSVSLLSKLIAENQSGFRFYNQRNWQVGLRRGMDVEDQGWGGRKQDAEEIGRKWDVLSGE